MDVFLAPATASEEYAPILSTLEWWTQKDGFVQDGLCCQAINEFPQNGETKWPAAEMRDVRSAYFDAVVRIVHKAVTDSKYDNVLAAATKALQTLVSATPHALSEHAEKKYRQIQQMLQHRP